MAFKRSLYHLRVFTYRAMEALGRTFILLGVLSLLLGFFSLQTPERDGAANTSRRVTDRLPITQQELTLRDDEIWEASGEIRGDGMNCLSDLLTRLFHKADRTQQDPSELSMVSPQKLLYKNLSAYEIDPEAFIEAFQGLPQADYGPSVLVIHTHTTEAYTPDEKDSYIPSDPFRTLDPEENMIRVGNTLCEILESRGISTLHDETLYDYPNYNNSYSRSLAAIDAWLEQYPSISVVLDLHRDAIEYDDGSAYRTLAEVNGEESAQVLILCGTDSTGLYHPLWRENLSFAFTLQSHMDAEYPGLSRPLKISQYRYNMQVTTGSLLIEIGSHGNTMSEALKAAECFADVLSDVLLAEPDGKGNN